MKAASKSFRIVTIYRPQSSIVKHYKMSEFHEEFFELMSLYSTVNDEIIFVGDYNIHVNKPQESDPSIFLDTLDQFHLTQHVTEPTHEHLNTLDLVITREKHIMKNHLVDEMLSDH
jgi:exonuclease III